MCGASQRPPWPAWLRARFPAEEFPADLMGLDGPRTANTGGQACLGRIFGLFLASQGWPFGLFMLLQVPKVARDPPSGPALRRDWAPPQREDPCLTLAPKDGLWMDTGWIKDGP